jgi:radical SAM superfamily enzyme YgiQ (UPF0313 family)
MADKNKEFLRELCQYHISGQLKIAPEHVNSEVLRAMRKPGPEIYTRFSQLYDRENARLGKEQYLVPYYISSHPGCTLAQAVELAEFLRDSGRCLEQVQDFIPTPGSCATAMYYAQIDPLTREALYVAKSPRDKAMQRALLQYKNPRNYQLVLAALQKAGRRDLIGSGEKCLIKSPAGKHKNLSGKKPVLKADKKARVKPCGKNGNEFII